MTVVLTNHVLERARERGIPAEEVRTDVEAAVEAGRKAKTQPRWATATAGTFHEPARRAKGVKAGTYRYAWNEAQTRCYLLARDGARWVVVTVYGGRHG